MSEARTKFEKAAATGQWQDAFNNLNALSITEMLASLSSVPKTTLDNLIARRFAFKAGVHMPRMEYAWTVVKSRKLPLIAPGDLSATGQVAKAAEFLNLTPPASAQFKLNFIAFTDTIVTNRTLLSELTQQADKILSAQGGAFKLKPVVHPVDIPLAEVVYNSDQLREMLAKAEQQTTIPKDHVVVLVVRVKDNVNLHGVAVTIDGRRVVAIDSDRPNPDRATLLHEMGHCAGLPHAGEAPSGKPAPVDVGSDDNVMAVTKSGVTRDALTVTQGEFLSKSFFATK